MSSSFASLASLFFSLSYAHASSQSHAGSLLSCEVLRRNTYQPLFSSFLLLLFFLLFLLCVFLYSFPLPLPSRFLSFSSLCLFFVLVAEKGGCDDPLSLRSGRGAWTEICLFTAWAFFRVKLRAFLLPPPSKNLSTFLATSQLLFFS